MTERHSGTEFCQCVLLNAAAARC